MKSDICERIADVSISLRSEITALKTEADASITMLTTQTEAQAETMRGLEEPASPTTNTVVELEAHAVTMQNKSGVSKEKMGEIRCFSWNVKGVSEPGKTQQDYNENNHTKKK